MGTMGAPRGDTSLSCHVFRVLDRGWLQAGCFPWLIWLAGGHGCAGLFLSFRGCEAVAVQWP